MARLPTERMVGPWLRKFESTRRPRQSCVRSRRSRRVSTSTPASSSSSAATRRRSTLGVLERLATRPNGKLIAVTAITPTKAGEGKTTTAISLTEGLGHIGEQLAGLPPRAVGRADPRRKGRRNRRRLAQVVPGEDINLHFTGDLHAIAAANNLLASAVDAHLVHGNDARHRPGDDHLAPLSRHRRPLAAPHRRRARRGGAVPA